MKTIGANITTHQATQFQVLKEDQCRMIYEAALHVMERTGCEVHNEKARQLLKNAGCRVDGIHVWIPPYVVEDALRTVPSQILVYDREGNPALHLGARNGKSYWAPGFENQYRIDRHTGEKKLTTQKDVYETGLVIDAMPNIDLCTGLAYVYDCKKMVADVYETRLLLETTTKPHWLWQFNLENLKAQIDMFAACAGGMDKFLAKPFVVAGAAASTPLAHADDSLEKVMYQWEVGIPAPYVTALMLGGTVPVTLAGGIVVGLADTFVGMVLSQLINRGCPYIAVSWVDMFDMSTMQISMTGPEISLGAAATADIFRYLNLPFVCHLGCTDAPVFDQ